MGPARFAGLAVDEAAGRTIHFGCSRMGAGATHGARLSWVGTGCSFAHGSMFVAVGTLGGILGHRCAAARRNRAAVRHSMAGFARTGELQVPWNCCKAVGHLVAVAMSSACTVAVVDNRMGGCSYHGPGRNRSLRVDCPCWITGFVGELEVSCSLGQMSNFSHDAHCSYIPR